MPNLRSPAGRWMLLSLPILYFFSVVAWPLVSLIRMSFSQVQTGRVFGQGFTFANYIEILTSPTDLHMLLVTFRIGAWSAGLAVLLGFPLALCIWRAAPTVRTLLTFITIAPILVSVVVRAYGWMVLLSNRGVVNSILMNLGIITRPLRLIFNETGIVIGTAHVLLPFMVLSILGSLQTIDASLEDAAASLGARSWRVTRDVIFPLALPGIVAGTILVFLLSVSSFVLPMLLGGNLVMTLPMAALQQFNATFNWASGSAYVGVLLVAVLVTTTLFERVLKKRLARIAVA